VPAGSPTVRSRRAAWEISSVYPRVFGAAYRFPLDTVAVNRGLKDGRGRTLIARALEEPSAQMPVAVLSWHLSQRLDDPLLVIAASPRLAFDVSLAQEIVIETGLRLLVDVLLYVASDHRAWALTRLPTGTRKPNGPRRNSAVCCSTLSHHPRRYNAYRPPELRSCDAAVTEDPHPLSRISFGKRRMTAHARGRGNFACGSTSDWSSLRNPPTEI
jgi:hypothetical protein